MKKIIFAAACALGCMFASAADSAVVTNVYDFKASLKVPYLNNGVRDYKSQTLKGLLYTEITDGQSTAMWLETQNNKTKVIHFTSINNGFYYLMGKSNKNILRSTPTLFYEAEDVEVAATTQEAHELITKITFAGTGTLKHVKTVTTSCAACGEKTKTTEYCSVLNTMKGNITGIMDCQCPDDEDGWWHTLQTVFCGVFFDDDDEFERKHEAAIWGTWTAKYNNKLSDTKIK